MYKLSVFVSGKGSNLKSLFYGILESNIKIVSVVTNKKDCEAVDFANGNNIPVYFVSTKAQEGFLTFQDLTGILKEQGVDLIVLAGFLKKIPDDFVDAFPKRIINIHPALLPSFGGKGMYGINVHKAVFDKSVQVSGATVHFVDKIYDNGKIIGQRSVDIQDVKTPEEIAERVLKVEHQLLPNIVRKFADNKVKLKNNRVFILD